MMTIQDAAKSWRVSEKTILNYILKGYIYNLSIENNEIVFPDVLKPYIAKKPKTIAEYDKYILTAMNKGLYVNAKIMDIEQDIFAERLDALIKANKIYPRTNTKVDQTTNLSFVLCSVEKKGIDVNITTNVNVESLAKVNATGQIGLVNAKVGG